MAEPPPLRVYPELWRQSRAQHPHDWRNQFRCLCRLARDYRRDHRAMVLACGHGERLFLQALDQCDPQEIIDAMVADFPSEPNPLLRIDPSDPFVDKSQYPDLSNDHERQALQCLTSHPSPNLNRCGTTPPAAIAGPEGRTGRAACRDAPADKPPRPEVQSSVVH